MAEFTIGIGGETFRVSGLFGSTPAYFHHYISEADGTFPVTAEQEDLTFEQKKLDEEADEEGLRRRVFTDPFLERAAIQRKVASILLQKNVLLLHGSTIAVDGKAYLFTAKTGTGKSTHTRFWREMLGERAIMVNDDRTFLRIAPDGVTAFGSPWSGKHGLDTNCAATLAGICILTRGAENRIRPATPEECFPRLLHEAFCPEEGQKDVLQHLTESLCAGVPLWHLECTRNPEAARVAYEKMSSV